MLRDRKEKQAKNSRDEGVKVSVNIKRQKRETDKKFQNLSV